MNLPPRRKRPKSGIERAPRREWPRHRRFVKSFECCVPDCHERPDFAHTKTRGSGGGDEFGVPLCREHHSEQHNIGIARFDAKYKTDLKALAAELVKRSTDTAMKTFLRLIEVEAAE